MTETNPVDLRKVQYDVLNTLATDRDDATPVDEVLAKLRDARHIVASERNQNQVSHPYEM